jgi:hypothetical protein
LLRRVTICGFNSPFIVDNGREVRDWETLKEALAKESARLRGLAELLALPEPDPTPEGASAQDSRGLSIDGIFGVAFPEDGGFNQFSVPFKDGGMDV